VRVEEQVTPSEGALPARVLVVGEPGFALDEACAALRAAAVDAHAIALSSRGWSVAGAPLSALEDSVALAEHLSPLGGSDFGVVFLALSRRDALAELDAALWAEQVERASIGLFVLAKALASTASLPRALGVVLSGAAPAWAGARGVARSLSREWPGVSVRSLCVEPAFDPSSAPAVARILLSPGASEQDLVMRGGALLRLRLEPRSATADTAARALPTSALVLVLGGADGITAEVTHALAQTHRCRFVAVGRTPMPDASPYAEVDDERMLKRVLFDELRASSEASDVPDGERLQRRLRTVLRQRAIWRTRSRVEAAGGTFLYHRADVSRPAELTAALAAIRAEHGPISGVVHGAGVTEDGLVTDKSVESFRRVLHTKTESAFALYAALRDEPLEFAFLFSSLSAHAGTAGQTDYVAGNEVLQAVARVWNERASYPARAILWSVWSEAGLASAGLKKQMDRLGLHGIRNEDGARLFGQELLQRGTGDDWVLLAPQSTLRFALRAGARRLGESVDHV
jgi:NAD(P)-dependent dehydrogenase (short-subunit alcohol dehydrogenase family)